jgi:ferredoxin
VPTLEINDRQVTVPEGATVLHAAQEAGIEIPTLCYHPALEPYAACRLCLVEVGTPSGGWQIVTACAFPAREGLRVRTDTAQVQQLRRSLLRLYLAGAPASAPLRELAARYGVFETDLRVPDPEAQCMLCGLCERVCRLVGRAGLGFAYRGRKRKVTPPFEEPLENCLGCGACVFVCPTGAVVEKLGAEIIEVEPWGARVPLATCRVCGEPVGPAAALEEVAERLQLDRERLLLCARCRRQQHGGELARSSRRDREKLAGRASSATALD